MLNNPSTEAFDLISARFKVLSEPIRLRMLFELQDHDYSVGELTNKLETSQPNVSKHLRILQDAGMVKRRPEGNTVYYSISDMSIFNLCETVCGSLGSRLKMQADIFA